MDKEGKQQDSWADSGHSLPAPSQLVHWAACSAHTCTAS